MDEAHLRDRTRLASKAKRGAANAVLRAFGFRVEGVVPPLRKAVVIGAPHTALVDGLLMNAFGWHYDVPFRWMVKHTFVRGSVSGRVLRALGAVPVDRTSPQGLVEQMVAEFDRHEQMFLVLSPEGTRARGEHWRSGFYWIARSANVPIVPAFLDFERRVGGIGAPIETTGNITADMDRVRAFYRGIHGKYPNLETPIRLRDEDDRESLEEPLTTGGRPLTTGGKPMTAGRKRANP